MKLELPEARPMEERMRLHRERHEESERQAMLAEAVTAYLQGGEKAIRELLEKQTEAREPEQA